ncbi:MAG: DUF1385 domain-containing protein [Anaerolineaceae bacterium]|nr:DUF1385 domain-containing protein [Anaerolineaceae bacterium]
MKERMPSYGGQAVIEGVLMRGKKNLAMAVRSPNGEIVIEEETLPAIYKNNIRKIPFLRGLIGLWDALGLGMKYLTKSANVQTGEDEKLEGIPLFLTLGLSLLIGIGLFFLAPAALAGWLENLTGMNAWWSNLIEGLLRLLILILYLGLIGKMKDVSRTFAYHGAEHKTINAFEANSELTPENVSKYSLEHPRCGTSFILSLVLVSVLLFSLFGPLPLFIRLLTRLLMIPVVAGIAYEYIRWTAAHIESPFVQFIIKPNLALQKLTTREPSLDMLEVSIAAFNKMYELENKVN